MDWIKTFSHEVATHLVTILVTILVIYQVLLAGSVPVRDFFIEKKYSAKIDGNREVFESVNGLLFEFQHFNKMFRVDKYVYFFNDLPIRKDNALLISDEDFDFLIKVARFYEERQPSFTPSATTSTSSQTSPATKSTANISDLPPKSPTTESPQLSKPQVANTKEPVAKSKEGKGVNLDMVYTGLGNYKIDYVFIDPGHGGRDSGASFYGFIEKDLNLELAKDLAQVLQNLNPSFKVVLTRNDDTYLTLEERCEIANRTLKPNENGIFISVHFNVWVDPEARGVEAFYLTGSEKVIQSKTYNHMEYLGEDQEGYFKKIFSYLKVIQYQNESRYLSDSIMKNIRDLNDPILRGSKNETFYVLKGALMPAVLLELGFISNREDMELINDKERRKILLERIGKAVVLYGQDFEKSNGF